MTQKHGCPVGQIDINGKCKKLSVASDCLPIDTIMGYAITKQHVIIKAGNKELWNGNITDIGAGYFNDLENGETQPYADYTEFMTGKELAQHFNLPFSILVFGTH